MDKQNLQKYINKKVYLVLKSGFKYKFVLKEEYIINESLSFKDYKNKDVDFDIEDISFITESTDEVQND